MLLALGGWMDGGFVSTGTVKQFMRNRALVELARIEHSNFYIDTFPGSMELATLLRPHVRYENGLIESLEMLAPGGRLDLLTFHSIEDRMVKNFMKTGNVEGDVVQDCYGNIEKPFKLVTKKPIEASPQETKANTRARSAKLRVAIKAGSM